MDKKASQGRKESADKSNCTGVMLTLSMINRDHQCRSSGNRPGQDIRSSELVCDKTACMHDIMQRCRCDRHFSISSISFLAPNRFINRKRCYAAVNCGANDELISLIVAAVSSAEH